MIEPSHQGPTDRELVEACIAGDRRAWATFVERYGRYVWYLVRLTARRCGDGLDDAALEDLHNDVFLALLEDDRRRLRGFRGDRGCSVRAWLRVLTIRRTLDALRRRRPEISLDPLEPDRPSLDPPDAGPDPLEQLLARHEGERRARLEKLAADLPAGDRLLLDLIYVQQRPVETICAALKINRGALYTRKTRLIQRLRALAAEADAAD